MRECCPYREAKFQGRLWTPAVLRPRIWVNPTDAGNTPTFLKNRGDAFASASATAGHFSFSVIRGRRYYNRTNGTCFQSSSNYCPYTNRFSVYSFGLWTDTLAPGIPLGGYANTVFASYDMMNVNWNLYNLNNSNLWYGLGITRAPTGTASGVPILQWHRRTSGTACLTGCWAKDFEAISGTMTIQDAVPQGTNVAAIYGRAPNIAASSNGLYGEVITFDYDIGSKNEELVRGYMAWNAGSPEILPASHPFRNRPPLIGD